MISGKQKTDAINKLIEAGIDKDDARFDIDVLEEIYISSGEEAFQVAVNRRAKGEPVAYIVGHKPFYMEDYFVVPGVLIPRSDTEILVEAALKTMNLVDFPMGDIAKVNSCMNKDEYKILDLCTGTGCVGISIANAIARKGKKCRVILGDISPVAIECSTRNIDEQIESANHVDIQVKKIDVLHDDYRIIGEEGFDIITSNPPYITDEEMEELPIDVKNYEPDLALRAGDNGLEFYNEIAGRGLEVLRSGGVLLVEHGFRQGESVRNIFGNFGYIDLITLMDYGGNERVTIGRKV